jgi:hypothetical protein
MNKPMKLLFASVAGVVALGSLLVVKPTVAQQGKFVPQAEATPTALSTPYEFCFDATLSQMSCEDQLIATAATGRATFGE